MHPQINAGILSAYRNGIVSSTSLLVTLPDLEQAIAALRASGLPVGLHLCLTQGRAVSPPDRLPDLVDDAGYFRNSPGQLLRRAGRSDRLRQQVRAEFIAQLSLAKDHGLQLDHIDSHQHVHMDPAIFEITEDLAPHFGIHAIRFVREPAWSLFAPAGLAQALRRKNHLKWVVLRWISRTTSPRLRTTDGFFGLVQSGTITKAVLMALLSRISSAASIEICVHPAFHIRETASASSRHEGVDRFTSSTFRRIEHDALVDSDVSNVIRLRRLNLMSYTGEPKRL